MAIQRLHSARSVCASHFDEAKATGTTGVAIIDQRHRLYRTMFFEQCAHCGFVHREREIANIHFRHVKNTYYKRNYRLVKCQPPGSKKPALWVVAKVTPERRADQKRTK
ncbi:MAG TPA: hypothetical protein VKH13_16130 [Steroidobacteraceae bacterium]|nr:hypothetical protein [Steroidobacteraceae bacterium]